MKSGRIAPEKRANSMEILAIVQRTGRWELGGKKNGAHLNHGVILKMDFPVGLARNADVLAKLCRESTKQQQLLLMLQLWEVN